MQTLLGAGDSGVQQVNMMRATAKLLARGTGLHVQGEHGWRPCSKDDFEHGDFEFFNRRMAVVQ